MKKSILALTITSILLPVSTQLLANQQTSADSTTDIERVTITANRTTNDKFNVLAAVDVFNRDAIDKIQAVTVADLLQQVAGISISTQGTSAHQTSVFVRGANSDHVLILIDGIRVGSASLGVKNLADIPLPLIERVEIVRGPRAALWGSDAIGGVIQLFTRKLNQNEAQIGLSLGSHNAWESYGSIGLGNEKHQYTLSASSQGSNGFDVITPDPTNPYAVNQPDNDGFHREGLALTGSSQLSKNVIVNVSGQINQGNTEIDANYSGDETDYVNHQFVVDSTIQFADFSLQGTLATSSDDNEDNYADIVPSVDNNRYKTKRNQASLLMNLPFASNSELIAGIDWYQEKLSSNTAYSKTKRNASAVYITGRHQITDLSLEASLRRDSIGDTDAETTYQLGLGYQLTPQWLLALTKGTSFKAPTFNDLYWPEAFGSAGNPNLVSETADNVELLTRFQQTNYSVQLSLYQTDFNNLIEWAPIVAGDYSGGWQPSNVAQAKIKGAELTLSAEIDDLSNRLTLSHIDAKNEISHTQLARRPYFTASYSVDYHVNDAIVGLVIEHQGKRTDSNSNILPSHTLLNLTASYPITPKLTLNAKINNALSKRYVQVSEYYGDIRNYSVSVDYRF